LVFAIGVGRRLHVGGRLHSIGWFPAAAASAPGGIVLDTDVGPDSDDKAELFAEVVKEEAVEGKMRDALCGGFADGEVSDGMVREDEEDAVRGRLADAAAIADIRLQVGIGSGERIRKMKERSA